MKKFYSLVSEHDDVVEEAPAPCRALAGGLPEETGGVDDGAEEDGTRNVAEQPEDHELDAQGERLLFLFHRSGNTYLICQIIVIRAPVSTWLGKDSKNKLRLNFT